MSLFDKNWLKKSVSLWKYNSKLEFVCLCLGMLMTVFWLCKPLREVMDDVPINVSDYFSSGRVANLTALFAIIIGVYIATISILATSVIGISGEIVKHRMDKSLLFVAELGCVENIAAVFLGVMFSVQREPWCIFYLGLLAASSISFLKFVRIMFLVFRCNMDRMATSIDREEADRNEILMRLEQIEKEVQSISKKK